MVKSIKIKHVPDKMILLDDIVKKKSECESYVFFAKDSHQKIK